MATLEGRVAVVVHTIRHILEALQRREMSVKAPRILYHAISLAMPVVPALILLLEKPLQVAAEGLLKQEAMAAGRLLSPSVAMEARA